MTPAEATDRTIKSRQMLHRYERMVEAGDAPHFGTVAMIEDEIGILAGIAAEHPNTAQKLAGLTAEWRELQDKLRGKMN